jgi:uncharacterized glyoxalase superfamily protein PhnB
MSRISEFLNVVPLVPAGDDVAEAIAYYEHELGFQKLWYDGDPIETAAMKRDGVEVLLYRNADRSVADQTSLRIRVTHVDQLYSEMRTHKAITIREDARLQIKPWGTKEFSIVDLTGVCITFYEPTE